MAEDSLITRMTSMAARLGSLPVRFGLPQYRRVILVPFEGDSIELLPLPKVEQVGQRKIGQYLSPQVQITGQELVATVNRGYDIDVLRSYDWVIDADDEGNGTVYTCEYLDSNGAIDYVCYLSPRSVL